MSAVERWRMLSGSVASICLSDHPDAVQGARDLLGMNGATLIAEPEPIQAYAGDEYDANRAQRAEQRKAPEPGGHQVEGENQKPEEESVNPKATRRTRAAAARLGTVARDHRITIIDTPDRSAVTKPITGTATTRRRILAESELVDLPVIVRASARRATVWRTADGNWWRTGGTIRIQEWEGSRAFVLFVQKGANSDDVRHMLEIVSRTRRGEDFDVFWDAVDADWADELTYSCRTARRYSDPYTHRDIAQRVRVCTDDDCVEQWHSGEAPHVRDSITRDISAGSYSVSVERDRKAERWVVNVYADDFYGSPEDVASLVSDLQWMHAECARLNQRNGES